MHSNLRWVGRFIDKERTRIEKVSTIRNIENKKAFLSIRRSLIDIRLKPFKILMELSLIIAQMFYTTRGLRELGNILRLLE